MAKAPNRPSGQTPANRPAAAKTAATVKPATPKTTADARPAQPTDAPEFLAATTNSVEPGLVPRTSAAKNLDQAVAEARLDERRAAARTTAVVAAVAGVVIVALVIALVVVTTRSGVPSASPTATATGTQTADSSAAPTVSDQPMTDLSAGQIAPPNADATQSWIEVKAANVAANALIVDMHVDFQCPWCGIAETNFGQAFDALAERGDIIYRLHIRTFVGDMIIKNDSSLRASMAAACADVVGSFLPYFQTVFTNQPQEGVGYTDQQLAVDFATQAGLSGDTLARFQACYSNAQTRDFATNMEANNWNLTTTNYNVTLSQAIHSTPSIFVNGNQLDLGTIMQTSSPYGSLIDNSADGLLAVLNQVAGR